MSIEKKFHHSPISLRVSPFAMDKKNGRCSNLSWLLREECAIIVVVCATPIGVVSSAVDIIYQNKQHIR